MGRVRRVAAVMIVLAVMIGASAVEAYAVDSGQPYWVLGFQGPYDVHPSYRYWGVSSSVLCPSTGPVVADKVCSIYAFLSYDNYFETGLVRRPGWSSWHKFTAYERLGYTTSQQVGWHGEAAQGQWYYFELNNRFMDNDPNPGVLWRANVAGSYYDRDMNFYKASAHLSSERGSTQVSGAALYGSMKFRDYDGLWLSWAAYPNWTRSVYEQWYVGVYADNNTRFQAYVY